MTFEFTSLYGFDLDFSQIIESRLKERTFLSKVIIETFLGELLVVFSLFLIYCNCFREKRTHKSLF